MHINTCSKLTTPPPKKKNESNKLGLFEQYTPNDKMVKMIFFYITFACLCNNLLGLQKSV